MFIIPEKLIPLHNKIQKTKTNNSEDNNCYNLEEKLIRPIIYKSEIINKLANDLLKCETRNKFNRSLKNIFFMISNKTGLQNKINFKLNLCKKNYKSYYHSFKDTVYMNKEFSVLAFDKKDKKYVLRIIYTLIHELAHAKVDKLFSSDGIHRHDYFFIFCLLENIEQCTEVKLCSVLNNSIKSNCYNDILNLNFDAYIHKHNIMTRANNKELFFDKSFDKIDILENYLVKKTSLNLMDNFNKNSLIHLENNSSSTILHYQNENNESPFSNFVFYIYKTNDVYFLYIFKEFKYHIRSFNLYLNYLKHIYKTN
jgi:hypothetical protein